MKAAVPIALLSTLMLISPAADPLCHAHDLAPSQTAALGDSASPAAAPRAQSATAAPGEAPSIVLIDEIAHFYGPVVFDHALHADMSELIGSCTNCHHEQPTGEAVASCVSCHSSVESGSIGAQPGLRGAYHRHCLSCHLDWSHTNGCGFCHSEATASAHETFAGYGPHVSSPAMRHLKVRPTYVYQTIRPGVPVVTFHHADHTELFGVSCESCHTGQSCAQCHGPASEAPTLDREQTCMGCHADRGCTFCHHVAPRPRFDHAQSVGWSLEPWHSDLACAKCHGEGDDFTTPDADRCRDCHRGGPGQPFDHAVTGLALDGSHAYHDCIDCHYVGTSARPACNKCHAAGELIKPCAETQLPYAEFRQIRTLEEWSAAVEADSE